jgi:hypothetical protein
VAARKELIEVALPLDEINKASTREESIRRGHPGTLRYSAVRRTPVSPALLVLGRHERSGEISSRCVRSPEPLQVARDNGAVSFARLLHVHRSGDIGSPRVTGSTNASKAAFTPGCESPIPGRPVAARRMRMVTSRPCANSRRPFWIVSRARPVAAETNGIPAVADRDRGGGLETTRPFIQQRRHDGELADDRGFEILIASHAA